MKKGAIFALVFLACAIILASPVTARDTSNIAETNEKIRVFIGDSSDMNYVGRIRYAMEQKDLIDERFENTPSAAGEALIAFETFLSPQDAESLLRGQNYSITYVYIWVPNKVGRAILHVENDDMETSINKFLEQAKNGNAEDLEYQQFLEELTNNYGIFAMEVKGTYSFINSLKSERGISQVDLVYSERAEQMAMETGKSLSYCCVPAKPDGTK